MKSPAELLRIGLIWGALVLTAAPGPAQEAGSAAKASAVTVAELPPAAASRPFRSNHRRFQQDPRNLPVNSTAQPERRLSVASPQSLPTEEPQTLPILSPPASLSFLALPDNGDVAPPDTFGAVGPSHLVVACASELRISGKGGNVISTVSQEHFWTNVARNIFDTRVVYDPYGQRFIMTAAADPGGTNPRLCIAVSSSSDPTGAWYRWSEDVDASNPVYADSPTLGFNKTWIVVQANMYNKSTHLFFRSQVYAYNKANLYANGTGQRTVLNFHASLGGSQVPATMYDSTNSLVYFAQNWNGYVVSTNSVGEVETDGYLRLYVLSGGIGSERLNITNAFGQPVFVTDVQTWAEGATNDIDILPQLGSTNKIYAGDSRIQNAHFRDGLLYLAQTVFLPSDAPTRAAVQWWAITAGTGEIRHFGRVDDASGTNMFAYPSIAANRYQDVLLGYSRFSSNEYPSAAYSFRQDLDPTDELRGEVLLKAGQAPYNESTNQNRWGDWSATTVDVNDTDLWTIQQYAAPLDAGRARWGTWWGRVSPPVNLALTITDAPDPVPTGTQLTYTLRVTNKQDQVLSGVRVQSTLPPNATYVSSTTTKGNCTHTSGVLGCNLGGFIEHQAETITLTVLAGTPGFATNTATVWAAGPDVDPSDNTVLAITEVINSADLQVTGTDNPDPVHVGNTLTYSLTISNRGPSAAAGVVMTSTLPASVTLGAITTSQGISTINGNQITFTFGSINNGGTVLITIACTPNTAGMITNQLRVAANTFDPAPGNSTLGIATRANARPVITQIGTQTITEDVATAIPITVSDAETPAANLLLSATSSNQGLIPNSNIVPGGAGANRTLTITSAPNQFGSNTTSITVTLTDADGASSTMVFPINVAGANDRPTISDITDPPPINEDTSISLNFNVGDIDTPLSALTLSANSSNGVLLPIENISFTGSGSLRTITLSPATNRFGTTTVTVTVNDGGLNRNDTFVLTVSPVNDPPVISTINPQTTIEDTPTAPISFTVSDPETPAADLTVTATSAQTALVPNANLTLANLGSTRTISANPAANQHGTAFITLRVSDGTNAPTSGFELTVLEANDPPTLTQPLNRSTNEDAGVITVPLTGIGSGAPNESQTLSLQASTSTPELVENLQINYNSPDPTGTLTFKTVTNAVGTAFIDVVVSDGVATDNVTRQFQVTITQVNDPPTIDRIDDVSVLEDSGQSAITLTGISSGAPGEANQTNISITAASSAPAIVPNPQIIYVAPEAAATLRFTPVAHAHGTARITVTVDDNRTFNSTTIRTFDITVLPVNDLPTISSIGDRTIDEDGSTGIIAFNFHDVEPGALAVTGFSSHQTLVPDANVFITGAGTNRNLTVIPRTNEFGEAMITVRVTDSEGGATNRTFRLTVNPVNDPPTLASIPPPGPINEDAQAQTVNLTGISPGPSNEAAQTLLITATSSDPLVVPNPVVNYTFPNTTGSLTYTPVANATGSVVITVTVDDRQAANHTTNRQFTVQINPVNDLPTIVGDFDPRVADEDVPLAVSFTIGDIETPAGSLTLRGSSSNPELVADTGITFSGSGPSRTVTVRPLTNEFGFTLITITVADAQGAETEAAFELFVNETNDLPTLNPINDIFLSKNPQPQTVPLSGITAGSGETQPLSVTATSSNTNFVSHPTVSYTPGNSSGALSFIVAAEATGSATISVRVSDGVDAITENFTVTVAASNLPPFFLSTIPPLTTPEDTPIGAAFTVMDDATYSARLTLTATSTNTTLVPNANIVFHGSDSERWVVITPALNASGITRITITANDGTNNTAMHFNLTVTDVNDPPTLGALPSLALTNNPPNQTINLSGINAGAANENQTLSIRVTSSNPALVPPPTTTNYTSPNVTGSFALNPNPGTGSALITVTIWDNGSPSNSFSRTFNVYIRNAANTPPTITALTNRATAEDTPITVPFTIGDSVTPAADLLVGASSSNPNVVSTNAILFGGAGANRSMTITPVPDRAGSSTITVWVLDTQFGYTATNFTLQVTNVNDAPVISSIPAQTINVDSSLPPVPFSISDAETASQNLTLSAVSLNQALLPNSGVILGGSGTNRSVMAYPAAGQTGSATISVTVTDPIGLSANTSFVLTIRVERPTLSIRRSGPTTVDLLWPTQAGLYTLQGRDQLNSGDWANIIATPSVSGTNYLIQRPISGPHRFFRLRN